MNATIPRPVITAAMIPALTAADAAWVGQDVSGEAPPSYGPGMMGRGMMRGWGPGQMIGYGPGMMVRPGGAPNRGPGFGRPRISSASCITRTPPIPKAVGKAHMQRAELQRQALEANLGASNQIDGLLNAERKARLKRGLAVWRMWRQGRPRGTAEAGRQGASKHWAITGCSASAARAGSS
jgi:hypothetical protein